MDNICHSLVGAAMARAGLARASSLGTATLIIGANFPDIDAIAVPLGYGLEWRRGWTHGVLAHVVLPFVLTGLVLAWDRLVRRCGARGAERPPADGRVLLLLATLSIWTHPLLDYMNVYGMRWLMPFSSEWFYADVLFIVDLWMWLALGAGVFFARRARRSGPARLALGVTAAYVVAMLASALAARSVVARGLGLETPRASTLMVGPQPLSPFARQVVVDAGDRYLTGEMRWLPSPSVVLRDAAIPKNADHEAAQRAAATDAGRAFLEWARFPFYEVRPTPQSVIVRIADARYAGRGAASWAERIIVLPILASTTPENR